jgi:hypothetical protein
MKHIILALALIGVVGINPVLPGIGHAEPLDNVPRIKKLIEVTAPEIYSVTITMEDGRVYETDRVALTTRSLERRFSLNSIDKTMRVLPKGEAQRITLNVDEIESINIKKVKPDVPVNPEKKPV